MRQPIQSLSKRSSELDLLRFFAVVIVFLGHYTHTFNYIFRIVPANLKYASVSRYASVALVIFFMVSGYVVTMTSVKRNLKEFLIARLSRIYPLFWVSCIVAFLLPRLSDHTYLPYSSGKVFLFNLTMMPVFFGRPFINPVAHTLTIELMFYFLIALIIGFKLWNRILIVISVILAYCLFECLFQNTYGYIVVVPFTAGMLFYLIRIGYNKPWKAYILLGVNFFCSLMVAKPMADGLNATMDPNSHKVWPIVVITVLTYAVFLLVTLKKIRIKHRPVFQLMGEIAYPFYLFHVFFLFFYWYFSKTIQPDLLLLSIFLLVLLISWLLHLLVEKPLSKLAYNLLVIITNPFSKKPMKLQRSELAT